MVLFVSDIFNGIEFRVYSIHPRQVRKNNVKVTIDSTVEAFMKHVFRAVDRSCIVIFTLHTRLSAGFGFGISEITGDANKKYNFTERIANDIHLVLMECSVTRVTFLCMISIYK